MADQWKRTALLVIDMQIDFFDEHSVFAVPGASTIIPSVSNAIEIARNRGLFIIWVVREHDGEGRDVERFRRHYYGNGKPNPIVKGSKGAELVEGLEIKEGEYKLVKTRFSVQTPNCIRQTVFDAVALDYHSITLLYDATAAATPKTHHDNITDMENVGVVVKRVDKWLEV